MRNKILWFSNKFQSTIERDRKYSGRISHKMFGIFFFQKERQWAAIWYSLPNICHVGKNFSRNKTQVKCSQLMREKNDTNRISKTAWYSFFLADFTLFNNVRWCLWRFSWQLQINYYHRQNRNWRKETQ